MLGVSDAGRNEISSRFNKAKLFFQCYLIAVFLIGCVLVYVKGLTKGVLVFICGWFVQICITVGSDYGGSRVKGALEL